MHVLVLTLVQVVGTRHGLQAYLQAPSLRSASGLYFSLRTSTLRVLTLRLVGDPRAQRFTASSFRAQLRRERGFITCINIAFIRRFAMCA